MAGQQVDTMANPEQQLKLQDGQTLGREKYAPDRCLYQATGSMSDNAIMGSSEAVKEAQIV
jgi:hypothetical protein